MDGGGAGGKETLPALVLGLVALAAIAGIVYIVYQILNKKKPPPNGANCGLKGAWVSVADDAGTVVAKLKGMLPKDRVAATMNPWYWQEPSPSTIVYDYINKTWGWCRGEDPETGRIVAEGRLGDQPVTLQGCQKIMGPHAQVSKGKLVNRVTVGAEVDTRFGSACGCELGSKWPATGVLWSDTQQGCEPLDWSGDCSKKDPDGQREPPKGAAPCNDEGQWATCSCLGCPSCWQTKDHICSCSSAPAWCLPMDAAALKPYPPEDPSTTGVPMVGLKDTPPFGCQCPENTVPFGGPDPDPDHKYVAAGSTTAIVQSGDEADKWLIGWTAGAGSKFADPCFVGIELHNGVWETRCKGCPEKDGGDWSYKATEHGYHCCNGDMNACAYNKPVSLCESGDPSSPGYCQAYCKGGHTIGQTHCENISSTDPSNVPTWDVPPDEVASALCCPGCDGVFREFSIDEDFGSQCCKVGEPLPPAKVGSRNLDSTCLKPGKTWPALPPSTGL